MPPLSTSCPCLARSSGCRPLALRTAATGKPAPRAPGSTASPAAARPFSTTPPALRRMTRQRRKAHEWVNEHATKFLKPLPGGQNYMTAYTVDGRLKGDPAGQDPAAPATARGRGRGRDQEKVQENPPFPHNPYYRSRAILGEKFKENVWQRVMVDGLSVRDASVELGIDMRRVGAVVRMKEIEKEWIRTGKELAQPYHDAIMAMVPVFDPKEGRSFEPINDLPVHAATSPQIFWPTSESKQFTRVDAAKVFHDDLLPADVRIPHPQMIDIHRDMQAGLSREQLAEKATQREAKVAAARQQKAAREAAKERAIVKVEAPRVVFRIEPIKAEFAGKDGRGARGVGWRYGDPFKDRMKGQKKIPTRAGV